MARVAALLPAVVLLAQCGPDTVPPAPVTALRAMAPTHLSVTLTWTNPLADHTGTVVRRAQGTAAPASATAGTAVTDLAAPGATFTDTTVAPSTTYTYAVFAHDKAPNYATRVAVTVKTPVRDITPPAAVTAVTTAVAERSVTLTWINPLTDHTGTTVRRLAGPAPPSTPTVGDMVAEVPSTTAATVTDATVVPGTTYTYALFAHDAMLNYAAAAVATVSTPSDTTPPPPITTFSITPTDTSVLLTWAPPTSSDYSGATIRVKEGVVAPSSPEDGTPVIDAPSSLREFRDTGVHHSTRYTYAIFAHDAAMNWSAGVAKTVLTRPPSVIQGAVELGRMFEPASVVGRDGAASARIGTTETWIFGDTIMNPPTCQQETLHTATGSIGPSSEIRELREPLDACGAPQRLLEFQDDEPYVDTCHRTALWPASLAPEDSGERAALFLTRARFNECGHFPQEYVGVEVTSIAADSTTASRGTHLFGPDEHEYTQASVIDGYVYLYAEVQTEPPAPLERSYRLARAPLADEGMYDRSAYTFYAGVDESGSSVWSSEEGAGVNLELGGTDGQRSAGAAGVSVSWNRHLGKYLMVHAEFLGQNVVLRTADRPEGPWSPPSYVDVVDDGSGLGWIYNGLQHPSFSSADDRTLKLTYHSQGIRVVEVQLKP